MGANQHDIAAVSLLDDDDDDGGGGDDNDAAAAEEGPPRGRRDAGGGGGGFSRSSSSTCTSSSLARKSKDMKEASQEKDEVKKKEKEKKKEEQEEQEEARQRRSKHAEPTTSSPTLGCPPTGQPQPRSPPVPPLELDQWIATVLEICGGPGSGSLTRAAARRDLLETKSVEATIDRFFAGLLSGGSSTATSMGGSGFAGGSVDGGGGAHDADYQLAKALADSEYFEEDLLGFDGPIPAALSPLFDLESDLDRTPAPRLVDPKNKDSRGAQAHEPPSSPLFRAESDIDIGSYCSYGMNSSKTVFPDTRPSGASKVHSALKNPIISTRPIVKCSQGSAIAAAASAAEAPVCLDSDSDDLACARKLGSQEGKKPLSSKAYPKPSSPKSRSPTREVARDHDLSLIVLDEDPYDSGYLFSSIPDIDEEIERETFATVHTKSIELSGPSGAKTFTASSQTAMVTSVATENRVTRGASMSSSPTSSRGSKQPQTRRYLDDEGSSQFSSSDGEDVLAPYLALKRRLDAAAAASDGRKVAKKGKGTQAKVSKRKAPEPANDSGGPSDSDFDRADVAMQEIGPRPKRWKNAVHTDAQEKKDAEKQRKSEEKEALKLARALEKAAKQREKDQAKREKEELKLAKQREKEEKARQKEAEKAEQQQLKQANKLRDKHACTAEMILEIDPAAVTESSGGILVAAVQAVQARVSIATQPIPTAMRWRRRVTRVWDSDAEAWRPCEERVEAEPFALVRLAAAELSRAVVRSGVGVGVGVASNMSGVREMHEGVLAAYPGAKPIYLVEGIKEFMKQRARLMDQCIKSGIRGGAAQAAGTAALPPRVATKDELDAAMLWLQMQGDCFVQVSETIDESTRYIVSFTTSISTVPERKSRSQHALRLNFGDAVKCGTDMTDIWRRMLMEVKPCNELVAEAIVGRYPTYRSLIAAFNERGARSGAAAASLLLADIEVERVKTVRPIGQALSRRIYKAFMSTDAEFAIFDPHSGG